MNEEKLLREVLGAIEEADAYMGSHRVSESWRTISRLRDTLVRLAESKGQPA